MNEKNRVSVYRHDHDHHHHHNNNDKNCETNKYQVESININKYVKLEYIYHKWPRVNKLFFLSHSLFDCLKKLKKELKKSLISKIYTI